MVTFTADLGQGEELNLHAKRRSWVLSLKISGRRCARGIKGDFVFPCFSANACHEGLYLLGTSIARPLISKRLVEIAAETEEMLAHGATGKGTIRCSLNSPLRIKSRHQSDCSRGVDLSSSLTSFWLSQRKTKFIAKDKRGKAPFSVDANLLHTSSEGKVLKIRQWKHQITLSTYSPPGSGTRHGIH